MELDDLQRNWEAFGETDPLWAILTDPAKKNNRWNPEEFFASGQVEIDQLMDSVAALPVSLTKGAALDFGCGVGRLTQALCRHFQRCDGVDIAGSMIRLARASNRFGDRCQYHVNDAGDLGMFEDDRFDLIYSNLVLQHIPPSYSTGYIRDFVRVLKRDGVAVFQAPSETTGAPAGPTPDAMFRAEITASPSVLTALAGAPLRVVATVRNTSPHVWPILSAARTRYKFRLGNHWLTARGRMKQRDDGRADLVEDLGPSAEVTLALTVTAPADPGEYILELDMVQEHVAWFEDKGSPTCRLPVRVIAAAAPSAPAPAATAGPSIPSTAGTSKPPEMGMYCLPRSTVIDLVRGRGARLLHVEEYASAGPEFISYRYYVSK
jgi:SAM-dependent methyltransferase